ncbi:MAG: N-acetylmuramidase domain-containing protein [Pseudomonadota bacterium]
MTLWKGAAAPMSPHAFTEAADQLGCELAVIKAVWEVESAGRGFRKDGSLTRRFEPHHMPAATTNWKDSWKLAFQTREKKFAAAYAKNPIAALLATSWAGSQIMGFNAEAAGYSSVEDMIERMAADENEHMRGFVKLIQSWGLQPSLRSRDWRTLARRYNGPGQAERYAGLMEAAYRRHSGRASAQVLRLGDRGPAVKRLQQTIGVNADGVFGRLTEQAVIDRQEMLGLVPDGVVGAKTWAALEARYDAAPLSKPTRLDQLAEKATGVSAVIGTGAGAVAGVQRVLPEDAYNLLALGAVALLLAAGAALLWRKLVRNT